MIVTDPPFNVHYLYMYPVTQTSYKATRLGSYVTHTAGFRLQMLSVSCFSYKTVHFT